MIIKVHPFRGERDPEKRTFWASPRGGVRRAFLTAGGAYRHVQLRPGRLALTVPVLVGHVEGPPARLSGWGIHAA